MQNPPDLIRVTQALAAVAVSITVSAVAIASPGANRRIRLWSWHFGFFITTETATKWWADLTDAPPTMTFARMSGSSFQSDGERHWPGGLPIAIATGVTARFESASVPLSGAHEIFYTIENVT